MARLPRDEGPYLAWVPVGACDEKLLATARGFFDDRMKKIEGGPHELAQAMEQMHLCAVFKNDQSPSVARFLSARK